jgi:hypothetical protein
MTNVRWAIAAFDFDSSIPTAPFAKANEEVLPSMTALPDAKSFS